MSLENLHTTWYAGQFKGLWFKWDIPELRTSNIAEAFNRLLSGVVGVRYPRMNKLLLDLQGCTSIAKARLLNVEQRRSDGKRLHKKDILRRRRVEKEMNRFKLFMGESRGFLRTVSITTYCRRMSRFVTEKVV